mmetsp:Transcript_30594/g.65982  ORF Transcript_30594/g.65982 Transcript_30594/m.65982 type:complete len:372 (-) Transcript_30594:87-1202(-)
MVDQQPSAVRNISQPVPPPPAAAAAAEAAKGVGQQEDGGKGLGGYGNKEEEDGLPLDGDHVPVRNNPRAKTLTRSISVCPVSYGVHSIQNSRPEMEDAHCAKPRLGSNSDLGQSNLGPTLGNLSFFAVFDGHSGAKAADYAGERFAALLAEDRTALLEEPREALRSAFIRLETEWLKLALEEQHMDGTTAAVALLDKARQHIIVGNVGDSEVLLGTKKKSGEVSFDVLSEVHHVKRNPAEAERIAACGGRLWKGRLGHPRINPITCTLSVSRAIGDIFFKDPKYTHGHATGLIADPWIKSVDICTEDVLQQFLVLGCDGLWDTVSYQEVCDFVFEQLDNDAQPQAISEGLVNKASEAGSSDNITAIVMLLS